MSSAMFSMNGPPGEVGVGVKTVRNVCADGPETINIL